MHSLLSLSEHAGESTLGLAFAALARPADMTAPLVGSAALLALAGALAHRARSWRHDEHG